MRLDASTTALAVACIAGLASIFAPFWTTLWNGRVLKRTSQQSNDASLATLLDKRVTEYINQVDEDRKELRERVEALERQLETMRAEHQRMTGVAQEATQRAGALAVRVERVEHQNAALRESRTVLRALMVTVLGLMDTAGIDVPGRVRADFERDGRIHGA